MAAQEATPTAQLPPTGAATAPADAPTGAFASSLARATETFGQKHLDAIDAFLAANAGGPAFDPTLDFNEDGAVNFDDTIYVLSNWGQPAPVQDLANGVGHLTGTLGQAHLDQIMAHFGTVRGDDRYLDQADPNADGSIDFDDVIHVLSNWGSAASSGAPSD